MREAAERIVAAYDGTPYIFNLGHGFVPETPPEHVAELVAIVRGSHGV
jgi:uroporphyrinogen decarboxylase